MMRGVRLYRDMRIKSELPPMGEDSEPMTGGEGSRRRFAIILLACYGAVTGGFVGGSVGVFTIFATMPDLTREIETPLSWLLGAAIGGPAGAGAGLYLTLRLIRRGETRLTR